MCPVVCIKKEAAPPLCVEVPEGTSLLAALERRCNRDVAAGCRGGGCGVCRVRVWSGQFRSKAMSKAHINEEDLRQGVVLACRVFPQSDMEISPEEPVRREPFVPAGTPTEIKSKE